MKLAVGLLLALLLAGCGQGGPASTNRTSAGFSSLNQKIEFLHRYVTFRRTYESLDFSIHYQNNGGGLAPGPSEWDIRIVATVPDSELSQWIPAGAPKSAPDADWIKSVPTARDLSGIDEWYAAGRCVVGIDHAQRIVVYRSLSQ